MTIIEIINSIFSLNIMDLIAIGLTVIEVVYAIFAFLVLRQVHLMNESFKTPWSVFFAFLAWIHFLAAVLLFLLTIIL